MINQLGVGLFGLVALFAGDTQHQQKLTRFDFDERHMGTTFRIAMYAPNKAVAQKAAKAAFAKVATLDNIMSDYKPSSELRQLSKKAVGTPVKVSKELFTILAKAQALSRETNGAFDATIKPVVVLWYRARRTRELPTKKELQDALANVDWKKLELDPKGQTVKLLLMEMLLDLGGIAKGFAADAALAILRQFGIPRAYVAGGGDFAVGAPPPNKKGWKIGIAPLYDPEAKPKHYLSLKNAAVSTSGDVSKFVVINNKRYSHIVDPRTGLGLVGRTSVTVIAPNATTTDSYATAVCVMGPKKGLRFIEKTPHAAAYIVREDENGKLQTYYSKRFSKYELKDGK
ncbi:MAG: FAD:protein FMN transferase [Gemmataceae bacterium]